MPPRKAKDLIDKKLKKGAQKDTLASASLIGQIFPSKHSWNNLNKATENQKTTEFTLPKPKKINGQSSVVISASNKKMMKNNFYGDSI